MHCLKRGGSKCCMLPCLGVDSPARMALWADAASLHSAIIIFWRSTQPGLEPCTPRGTTLLL